jgi:hypothetical protein
MSRSMVVSRDANIKLAQELLNRLSGGVSPGEVSMLFSPDADWEITGDVGALSLARSPEGP